MTNNLAAREVYYLARVGAFDYVRAVREALTTIFGLSPPHVPPDALSPGLQPCQCRPCATGTTPRSRRSGEHDIQAFAVYAAAERTALDALGTASEVEAKHVAERLADGLADGLRVRAALLAKGCPVPGRGRWLIPEWTVSDNRDRTGD